MRYVIYSIYKYRILNDSPLVSRFFLFRNSYIILNTNIKLSDDGGLNIALNLK